MVSAAPLIKQPIPQPIGERRVVLRSLDWQGYLAIRRSLSPNRNTRLTYTLDREALDRSAEPGCSLLHPKSTVSRWAH